MPKSVGRATTAAPGVIRQEFSLTPQTPSASDDPEEKLSFWEHLASVPDNAWASEGEKGYKVYLYDEEQGKGSKYLELISQPFDIEWLRQNHGGGTYRAQLNDPSGRIVAKQIFSINGEPKRKPVTSVQNAPAAAVPVDSFQTSVLNMIQEGQRRQEALIERLMDRDRGYNNSPPAAPSMDPMALITPVLTGVVSVFTSMIPKPGNPLDDLLKLKQLMGQDRDVFSELAKFKELGLIGGSGGNGDLLKQLEVVMAVAEKIGIGGGGGKSVLEVIADKGPEMLGKIVSGIGEYRALEEARMKTATAVASIQANQPRVAQAPAPAALPANGAQPNPQPQNSQPASTSGVLQVDPIAIPPGQAAAVAEVTEAQVNAMKAEIVQIIAQGVSGQDLFGYLKIKAPEFLNGMLKLNEAGEVIGVVTVEELALYCSMDPVLQHAAQFPQYRQVLTELLEEVKLDTMGDEQAPDGGQ